MPLPLNVAFVWHQHQPLYKSPMSGKYLLPWVRLHGVKDYLDLALILEKYPKLHQTINLVPSLIIQLEDYVNGNAFDPYLELTLTPISRMDRSQKLFIIERFFDAYHRHMVEPYARYAELLEQKRQFGIIWCLENWRENDYSDLLAWFNLTWIDPLFRETDPEIQGWFTKARNFTLSDRQRIYSKQKLILAKILPQHHKMQLSGQLEIITSPYSHPILPLLSDTRAGRVAVPDMMLPGIRFRFETDIALQLEKGKQIYRKYFGTEPRGLWPSEQSVSPAILPYVSKQGFQWLCSDEGVLGWSLGKYFYRDEHGHVSDPNILYQPYRLETAHGDLAIVFRDRRLSDLIGFSYGSMSAAAASRDLIDRLKAIHGKWQNDPDRDQNSERPWLVTIALDGENCWEYYPNDGKDFLEALYSQLSQEESLKLVTVSEFITEFPPLDKIPPHQLHSGSWIDSNFTTWIGDPVKNRAWDLLSEARQVLANHPEATQENNPEAWENLFAAEGSDWFWWLGAGHSSSQDDMFDQLFREHLQALYRALNEQIPNNLLHPLELHDIPSNQRPEGFIHPIINGKIDLQDWQGAGRIEVNASRGTMHQSGIVQRLWYGLDHFNFYLRLDFAPHVASAILPVIHLCWFYPEQTLHNSPLVIAGMPDFPPLNYLFHHHLKMDLQKQSICLEQAVPGYRWQDLATQATFGLDKCFELSLPWSDLMASPGNVARLVILLSIDGLFQTSLPEWTTIPIDVP